MRTFTLLLLVFLNLASNSQNVINQGQRVYIDGIIEPDEWLDATTYTLKESEFVKTKVLLKHDGKNLLLAFLNNNIKDTTFVMPEVFIDSKLNKGEQWQSDDFWFHVSAQDCHAVGKREDYSNCRPDYTLWRASPNSPFGKAYEPMKVTEIAIPLNLINVTKNNSFGMCISLSLFPSETRINYPENAHEDVPASWDEYTIE